MVQLGNHISTFEFIVCKRLSAPVALGWGFFEHAVESILPPERCIELNDGTTVPIVRRPWRRPPNAAPLPPEQEYAKSRGRTSNKVRVAKPVTLALGEHVFVSVATKRHGLMVLQPSDKLRKDRMVIASHGVVQVQPDREFRVLVANHGAEPHWLRRNRNIGTLLPHPAVVVPSAISFAELLSLDTELLKREMSRINWSQSSKHQRKYCE